MSADVTAKSVLRVNTFISASLIIDRLFQKGDNVGLWPAGLMFTSMSSFSRAGAGLYSGSSTSLQTCT